jgi:hypothetical protein
MIISLSHFIGVNRPETIAMAQRVVVLRVGTIVQKVMQSGKNDEENGT